jgi:hypothetical protein
LTFSVYDQVVVVKIGGRSMRLRVSRTMRKLTDKLLPTQPTDTCPASVTMFLPILTPQIATN